ncbi:MAG: hypothetical protein K2L59_07510 [Muribaculaceae bacterium]|nr:hypothetical protein [Muribaculaceae bacterium]
MDDSTTAALAGLAQTIASVASQTVATQEDKHAQRRSFEYAMEMAKWQNATNISNWEMTNAYNSPTAQMKRLEEAGLNPNLVYQNGSSTAPASNPHATVGAPVPTYQGHWRIADAVNSALDGAFKAMQLKKAAQETENLAAYQRNTILDGDMKELQMIGQRYANSKNKEEAELWRDYWDQKIINMRATGQLTDSQRFKIDAEKNYINGPQTRYSQTASAKNIAEIGLMDYRKQLISAQITDTLASAGLKSVQAQKASQEIINLVEDYKLKGATLTSKELENELTRLLRDHGVNMRDNSEIGNLIRLLWAAPNNISDSYDTVKNWFK